MPAVELSHLFWFSMLPHGGDMLLPTPTPLFQFGRKEKMQKYINISSLEKSYKNPELCLRETNRGKETGRRTEGE